jgi:hypothetical protein
VQARNAVWIALGIFAVALGVMVGAFARTDTVRAQEPPPQLVTCQADFAALGIERDEDARVNASLVDDEGDPIDVRIRFLDRNGAVLQESSSALGPGETVSVDLEEGRVNKATRLDFRVAVLLKPGSGAPGFPAAGGCPRVATNLERLFHRSTTLVLNPAALIAARPCHECQPPPPIDQAFPADLHPPDVPFPDAQPADLHPVDSFPPPDSHPIDNSFPTDNPQ